MSLLADATLARAGRDSQLVSVTSLQRTLDSAISRKAMCTQSSRILIIDDEAVHVRTLKHHLAEAGYTNFLTTTDPTEATELIRQKRPDLVLLDIAMPEISGIDILHVISVDQSISRSVISLSSC